MFENYLTDRGCYELLEQYLYDYFILSLRACAVGSDVFNFPYYNTYYVNGTPFLDGNPIFSARNEITGQILRVVLDEDIHNLCSYRDKEGGCELVVVGGLALLDDIKEKISAWVSAQEC
ncbi:hypothetical protein [Pseudomonas sp.]|uniref:hypothetical protein n=1 Tax=Pseudomonas sp. TaxID=306 RepID=UPI0028ACD066|nr:hypothetical protein [Pseudomonas sp.]